MDELDLIVDLHVGNERQGPGSEEETLRALALARLPAGGTLEVADLGCGTGASALVLARSLGARVTAVDASEAFVDRLRERARAAGLGDRVEGVVGAMESLPFEDGRFDAVWSEGAIYNMGFGAGVRAWRRLLKPGGVLAVTELTWTTATRPAEVEAHWLREYPGIGTVSSNIGALESAGYRLRGVFFLPGACWEAGYYAPLRSGFASFLERHGGSEASRRIVAAEEAEMALYREYGSWYGYAFYVASAPGRARER